VIVAEVVDVDAGQRALADAFAGEGPGNLIDGRWRAPTGAGTEERFDPSRGATIGWLTYGSDVDVDDAVAAASEAQRDWSRRPLDARVAPLSDLAEAIDARRPSLVALIAIEVGKTLAEADAEIDLSIELIRMVGDTDRWARSGRRPLGVAAGISLYHYPLLSPLWMVLPALTAGNGYVLRPCTWSPVTGVATAELLDGAGYPTGLFNAVHGSLDTVNCILRHPGLSAVSYVGSGPWAQYMVDVGTRHGKRVDANGALRHLHVVADGADPAVAARRVCESAIGVAGQRWLAGCTVVTGAPIASTFVDELCAATAAVRVGSSTDPATSMGPVVQRFRQRELVDRVRDVGEGVDVLVDGSSYAEDVGYFFGPTVLDHVPAGHPLLVEQVPGPIISVVRDGSGVAADIDHRDAHGTVTTIHGGAPPAATRGWFGSLPWSWDHALRFFTSA
jgi:malonate-semialdehyde dehydrogenase (acetylating) / methylmalonate-semialdehyde dehydrogenase